MIQFEHATAESSFLGGAEPEALTSEQVNTVLNQLTSTIEIYTLVSLYFTQVNRYLPLVGIDMSEFDKTLNAGLLSSPAFKDLSNSDISIPTSGKYLFTCVK